MNTLKNQCLLASTHVQRLETDIVRYQAEAEESARRAEGRENINKERLEELKSLQSENRSLKTEMEETKHKLKQNQTMLKSTQGKGVSAGEVALQKERDMLFVSTDLTCSSVKIQADDTISSGYFAMYRLPLEIQDENPGSMPAQ
jgi:xanthine dehydrogenase molybdopterin-binding subunit B